MARKRRSKRKSSGGAGWRRSPITGGIAVIVILACLINLYVDNFGGGSSYKSDYVCNEETCQYQERMPVIRGGTFPVDCPKCEQKTLYTAMLCRECEKVTPILPSYRAFACSSCNHSEEVRLEPSKAPHPCPECNKKTFYQLYKCSKRNCGHTFPGKPQPITDVPEAGHPPMPEGYFDPFQVIKCPSCSQMSAYPDTGEDPMMEGMPTCVFCDSADLESVTPPAVIRYELGQKLNERDQKIVDEWEAKQ